MSSSPTVEETPLPGVLVLVPRRHRDERGWFCESWSAAGTAAAGLEVDFVQDNHAFSRDRNTLRGLHFQAPPHAQAKLVRCSRGAVLDVAVDIRKGSPTYGRWAAEELSEENGRQLFVPEGFAHGYLTLIDGAEVQYKCSAGYAPAHEGAVRWDSCGIDWPLEGRPVLSPKDADAPPLAALDSPFVWDGAR